MKLYTVALIGGIIFLSCKKETATIIVPPVAEAVYRTELRLQWTTPAFTIPAGAHFTVFVGAIHQKETAIWKPGTLASMGLENIAEVGNNVRMYAELDSIILAGKALSRFGIAPPAIASGYDTIFRFTLQHSCISFASMIAPSPDWFVGLSQYNMLQDGQWLTERTVPLFLYDAGTEDGDIFGYNNPATIPQQPVKILTPADATVLANGNTSFAQIGYVKFTKL